MKFHHIAISVRNLKKSEEFYVDNLGFEKINEYSKESWIGRRVIVLKKDVLQLELFGSDDVIDNNDDFGNLEQVGIKHFGFTVENVEVEVKKLKDKGVEIGRICDGTTCEKFCFIVDPNGIVVELVEEKKN